MIPLVEENFTARGRAQFHHMSVAADGRNLIFYQLKTPGMRCEGAVGLSRGTGRGNIRYSLTLLQGCKWHWWGAMYGNAGVKTL